MKDSYFYIKSQTLPIYRGKLIFILSNDIEKIGKVFPLFVKGKEEIYAHSNYEGYKGFEGFVIILNFKYKCAKITHGTIAHEALHVANYVAESRGIKLDANNDEHMAYLVDYIVDEVYKFIKKKGFKVE